MSYETPKTIMSSQMWREFDTYRILKLTCGPSFKKIPKGLTKDKINRLVEAGWLKFAHGRWWQVSIQKLFPMTTGTKKHWHSLDMLQKDVRAVLTKLDHDYLTDIHTAPQAPKNPRPVERQGGGDEKTRQLDRGSKHINGIAISIFMLRYGCSKGYVSKLRRLCERNGLAMFEERFRVTKWDTAAEGRAGGAGEHLFDGYGGAWTQLTSEYTPCIPAEMRTHVGRVGSDGWLRIDKVDLREISNFHSKTGPYAM